MIMSDEVGQGQWQPGILLEGADAADQSRTQAEGVLDAV